MERLKALVAEDEALIAYNLEATLQAAGFDVLGPYATLTDALEGVLHETPDLAIVDVSLRDDSAAHLIEILRNLSVPVVIVSGYQAPDDDQLQGSPWLTKPVMAEDLLSAIDKAMGNKELA